MRPTLKYSTLAESLAWLRLATGRDWTENELLDAATSRRITLHAAPPITANANLCELDLSRDAPAPFRVKCRLGWRMALLYPLHVAQIMHAGETETVHAAGEVQEPHEHIYFSEPFRAQREHVRVAQSALERLAAEFQAPTASVPTETAAPGAPLSRQKHQEREILRTLTDLGYDPQRLPRAPAGTPGPKAEVRKKLPEMTRRVFEKAWERLRGFGDIAEAE